MISKLYFWDLLLSEVFWGFASQISNSKYCCRSLNQVLYASFMDLYKFQDGLFCLDSFFTIFLDNSLIFFLESILCIHFELALVNFDVQNNFLDLLGDIDSFLLIVNLFIDEIIQFLKIVIIIDLLCLFFGLLLGIFQIFHNFHNPFVGLSLKIHDLFLDDLSLLLEFIRGPVLLQFFICIQVVLFC